MPRFELRHGMRGAVRQCVLFSLPHPTPPAKREWRLINSMLCSAAVDWKMHLQLVLPWFCISMLDIRLSSA
jgi:hypothetical protein